MRQFIQNIKDGIYSFKSRRRMQKEKGVMWWPKEHIDYAAFLSENTKEKVARLVLNDLSKAVKLTKEQKRCVDISICIDVHTDRKELSR